MLFSEVLKLLSYCPSIVDCYHSIVYVLQKNNQHAELWRYGVGAFANAPADTFKAHTRCIS